MLILAFPAFHYSEGGAWPADERVYRNQSEGDCI